MLITFVFLHSLLANIATRSRRRLREDGGQTTAEYALVLVGVAAIALLVLAWATKTGAVGKLFDFVLSHITNQVK